MKQILERVEASLAERRTAGTLRSLRVAEGSLRNLASNDYLGLNGHPELLEGARAALERAGSSASASPLLTGYQALHRELETALCDWLQLPASLLFNSGFAANYAILASLPRRGDLVFADRLCHHSLLAGILASGARLIRYPHQDYGQLARLLKEQGSEGQASFVVTESLFSMDGDTCELEPLLELRAQYGFCLLLDEAHALGWYGPEGRGVAAAAGRHDEIDLLVGTFGKAFASQGAFLATPHAALREHCVNFGPSLLYSTYLAPACVGASLAALAQIRAAESLRERGRALSRSLRTHLQEAGLAVPEGDSPIVPIPCQSSEACVKLAEAAKERGFEVAAVRPPTVPEGSARLRLSLRADLTMTELEPLLDLLTHG